MSIEDLKVLVQQEKESEEKLKKAMEEANSIVKKAREDADRILENAENPKQYDDVFQAGLTEINEKKKLLEKETEKKIERIRAKAKKNMEKATALIVKRILKE